MSNEPRKGLSLYGLKNCDTCKAAQHWLRSREIPFEFHDVRADRLSPDLLSDWLKSEYGPNIVNRRSATWRKLSEAEKRSVETDPVALLLANPTLMKRPVFILGGEVLEVGFSPADLKDKLRGNPDCPEFLT